MEEGFKRNDKVIRAMSHVVISDMLNVVLDEFEKNTDIQVGTVVIHPREEHHEKREVHVGIEQTRNHSVKGLSYYKKILCKYKPFEEDELCDT